MYFRYGAYLLFIWLLVIFQIGFISGLPGWLRQINVCLIAGIFILVLFDLKSALFLAVAGGLLFDFYSFNYFGTYILSFLGAVILSDLALVNFFTNRSLYSILALTATAFVAYQVLFYGLVNAADFFWRREIYTVFTAGFFWRQLAGLGINLIVALPLFYLITIFSQRLKPSILKKKI